VETGSNGQDHLIKLRFIDLLNTEHGEGMKRVLSSVMHSLL